MNIKLGDILKCKVNVNTESRKVLGILNNLYFLSNYSNHNSYYDCYTLEEIEEAFELPKEKWVPKNEEKYFFVTQNGGVTFYYFVSEDSINEKILKHGNYFKTEKEAQEAADKIKELLISLKK